MFKTIKCKMDKLAKEDPSTFTWIIFGVIIVIIIIIVVLS